MYTFMGHSMIYIYSDMYICGSVYSITITSGKSVSSQHEVSVMAIRELFSNCLWAAVDTAHYKVSSDSSEAQKLERIRVEIR